MLRKSRIYFEPQHFVGYQNMGRKGRGKKGEERGWWLEVKERRKRKRKRKGRLGGKEGRSGQGRGRGGRGS